MSLRYLKQQKKCLSSCKIASAVRYPNLVLSYKGNKCKGYKWILALLKPKRLIKKLVKELVKE